MQIIASFNEPGKAQERDKERWQVESCFKAVKSSGFNIEYTHLRDIERVEKLFALVFIAFTWVYITGLHIYNNIKTIRICKLKGSYIRYNLLGEQKIEQTHRLATKLSAMCSIC